MGDRVYVSDVLDSVFLVKYRRPENSLVIFADDYAPRAMTAKCLLDYDTVCGADKFGNVFVLRLPSKVSDDVDNPTGAFPHPE
jgi:splicing factor 3B subunit 3